MPGRGACFTGGADRDGEVRVAAGSTRVVIAALIGNAAIAAAKYVAAAASGSSAMFAEAVHSTVDTGNQACCWSACSGRRGPPTRGTRSATARRFTSGPSWSAILLFGLGAGVSIYEGLDQAAQSAAAAATWAGATSSSSSRMAFEAGAWLIAWREFARIRGATAGADGAAPVEGSRRSSPCSSRIPRR